MTQAIEQPTRLRRHTRSYSQLSSFLHCGEQYRLQRVLHIPERPSVWLAAGKAFHTATEVFDKATWQEEDLTSWVDAGEWQKTAFDELFDLELASMREEYPLVEPDQYRTAGRKTKDKPNGEDIAWWRVAGADMVAKYVDWRVKNNSRLRIADDNGVAAIELEVDMPLGGVPMRGYVDRVLQDQETGAYLMVDLKSGARMPVTPLQLATYATQLSRRFPTPIRWGAFYDARRGSLSESVDLSRFDASLLGDVYRRLDRAINLGLYLPNIGTHCSACGVRDACIYRGGTPPT